MVFFDQFGCQDALAIAESADVTWVQMSCQQDLARALSRLGRHHEGLCLAIESVKASRRQGAWALVWEYLLYTASALEGLGAEESAARLLGGVAASPVTAIRAHRRRSHALQDRLKLKLGEKRLTELLDQGRSLTPQQAVEIAETAAEDHLTLSPPDQDDY